MNHTDLLQGFDMVAAITNKSLNDQIQSLFDQGLIAHQLEVDLPKKGKLTANIAAPRVQILAGQANARKVLLILPLKSGLIKTFNLQDLRFKNWQYAFTVDLDMQSIATNAIANNKHVPKEVKDNLSNFKTSEFDIRHIFMDFNNVNFASFDAKHSFCPLDASWGGGDLLKMNTNSGSTILKLSLEILQNSIENFFTAKEQTKNPYILGYFVNNKNVESNDSAKATFSPTSATFSTTYAKTNPAENSTLNFLITCNNRPLPTGEGAGIFTEPSVVTGNSSGSDGCLVLARSLFMNRWLLPEVKKAMTTVAGGAAMTNIPTGWSFDHQFVDHNGPTVLSLHSRYTNNYNIKVAAKNGQPKVDLTGEYDINAVLEREVLLHYEIDAQAKQPWSGNFKVSIGKDSAILVNYENHKLGAATSSYHKNGPANFLNVLSLGELKKWILKLTNALQDHAKKSVNQFKHEFSLDLAPRLILPAGNLFQFTSPEFDNAADLRIPIKYAKSKRKTSTGSSMQDLAGKTYPTVTYEIDGKQQTWMAANLDYDAGADCWYYDNNAANGTKLGRLYTWEAAKRACPPGWRLPTRQEYEGLISKFGGPKTAFNALKEGGSSGFNAVMGGWATQARGRSGMEFIYLGWAYYWTGTSWPQNNQAWYFSYDIQYSRLEMLHGYDKSQGFSVRYIKND